MLAISSHWPRLEKWYVDAGGCRKKSGRDRADGSPYTCSRIPEQGNSFMAPVFGRSSLNVLRQIYLQSRVLERLQAFEERGTALNTMPSSGLASRCIGWRRTHRSQRCPSNRACGLQ